METIQITLNLFNRPFKLKVNPTSEQRLREAVKKMNENIANYKTAYTGRDDFEYLAMAVMSYISDTEDKQLIDNNTNDGTLVESLHKIENILLV